MIHVCDNKGRIHKSNQGGKGRRTADTHSHTHGDRPARGTHEKTLPSFQRFQRFQHCKASPKLPVLPTNPAGSLPSAEAAGTGVDGWDEPWPPVCNGPRTTDHCKPGQTLLLRLPRPISRRLMRPPGSKPSGSRELLAPPITPTPAEPADRQVIEKCLKPGKRLLSSANKRLLPPAACVSSHGVWSQHWGVQGMDVPVPHSLHAFRHMFSPPVLPSWALPALCIPSSHSTHAAVR